MDTHISQKENMQFQSERERDRDRKRKRPTYHINKCCISIFAMGPSRSTSFYLLHTNETVEVSILNVLISQLPKAGEDPWQLCLTESFETFSLTGTRRPLLGTFNYLSCCGRYILLSFCAFDFRNISFPCFWTSFSLSRSKRSSTARRWTCWQVRDVLHFYDSWSRSLIHTNACC